MQMLAVELHHTLHCIDDYIHDDDYIYDDYYADHDDELLLTE